MDERRACNLNAQTKEQKETTRVWIRQAVIFCFVGVLNTAVDFVTFFILVHFFSVFYAAAQVVAYGAGMLNSYFWNSKVTFSNSGSDRVRFLKFVVLNLSVLLLTLIVMHGLLFLPIYVNKLISTAVGLVFNFTISKMWVFKSRRSQ